MRCVYVYNQSLSLKFMSPRPTPYWPSFHGQNKTKHSASSNQDESSTTDCNPKSPSSDQEKLTEALRYITHYPSEVITQVQTHLKDQSLKTHLLSRYPEAHSINSNKLLRTYTNEIKNKYMRSSERLSKVCYDEKLHLIHHALGTQSFVSLAHGGRLKARRELRVSSLFKHCPEPLLKMIVVHELAHLREKEHNQAFYRLCVHMESDYHRLEFDARLYLMQQELFGPLYIK